jgi:hypothetical protein
MFLSCLFDHQEIEKNKFKKVIEDTILAAGFGVNFPEDCRNLQPRQSVFFKKALKSYMITKIVYADQLQQTEIIDIVNSFDNSLQSIKQSLFFRTHQSVTGLILFIYFDEAGCKTFVNTLINKCRVAHMWKIINIYPWAIDVSTKRIYTLKGQRKFIGYGVDADKFEISLFSIKRKVFESLYSHQFIPSEVLWTHEFMVTVDEQRQKLGIVRYKYDNLVETAIYTFSDILKIEFKDMSDIDQEMVSTGGLLGYAIYRPEGPVMNNSDPTIDEQQRKLLRFKVSIMLRDVYHPLYIIIFRNKSEAKHWYSVFSAVHYRR